MKPFPLVSEDNLLTNYYMEREWRMYGNNLNIRRITRMTASEETAILHWFRLLAAYAFRTDSTRVEIPQEADTQSMKCRHFG